MPPLTRRRRTAKEVQSRRWTHGCLRSRWPYRQEFAATGRLNAPWGWRSRLNFGPFAGTLLVGNFGDGTVVALIEHRILSRLFAGCRRRQSSSTAWGLAFRAASVWVTRTRLFTAGPDEEQDGIFGRLRYGVQPSENGASAAPTPQLVARIADHETNASTGAERAPTSNAHSPSVCSCVAEL
jgi:hypothetical protein